MITDISSSRGKSSIYFDGIRYITARTADIYASKIKVGDEIEPEEVMRILAKIQVSACYETALTILDSCAQTRASMMRKLSVKGYVPDVCEQIVEKLVRSGLIDENTYSERLVEYQSTRAVSRLDVRRKLVSKGIDPETIEESLSIMDDEQQLNACRKAVAPLLRRFRALDPKEAKKKTAMSLARKGFQWDICNTVLEEIDFYE